VADQVLHQTDLNHIKRLLPRTLQDPTRINYLSIRASCRQLHHHTDDSRFDSNSKEWTNQQAKSLRTEVQAMDKEQQGNKDPDMVAIHHNPSSRLDPKVGYPR
jgi:hypothetical protein